MSEGNRYRDDPTTSQSHYCPKCGARIVATEEQVANRVRCSRCQNSVRLFTYPTLGPIAPAEVLKDNKTRSILVVSVGLASLVSVAILILVASGQLFTASFFAFATLLGAISLIIVAVERHHRVVELRHKLEYADELKEAIIDAIQKWRSLEKAIASMRDEAHSHYRLAIERETSDFRAKTERYGASLSEARAEFERKLEAERASIAREQFRLKQQLEEIQEHRTAVQTVAEKYVKDIVGWVTKNVTSNNFANSKEKIEKAIEFCRRKGAVITSAAERDIYSDLKERFEEVVRKEAAKAEQQRIKEKIREEAKAQAEIERELQRLANERAAIERAIAQAMARTMDEHSAEVEELRRRLQEAEEGSQRAMSMAQQTKSGNVYVISNIGAFGENVFKIGMTRRLEPMDRVRELGDASVPFPFDVHMMISCDNAPALENALHKKLHDRRLNKVNFRKEFFRASIDEIRQIVEANHGKVEYVATPEALEYYESQHLTGQDLEFVESVLDKYQSDDED